MVWSQESKYACHLHIEVYMWFWVAFSINIYFFQENKNTLFARVARVASGLLGKTKFIFQDVATINHYTRKGQFLAGNLADELKGRIAVL